MSCILTLTEIVLFKSISTYHTLSLILSIVIVVLIGALSYFTGFIGGADVFTLLFLALLFPWRFTLYSIPIVKFTTLPIVTFIVNSIVITFSYSIYYLVLNLTVYRGIVLHLNAPLYKKVILVFLGFPLKISRFLRSRFLYPLEIISVRDDGVVVREFRLTFNVEEDYREHIEYIRKLVMEGVISENTYIWVTHGIPLIVFLLLGFTMSITLGDIVLYSFLKTLNLT